MKIEQASRFRKATVGASINKIVADECRIGKYPMNLLIEASLISFLRMNNNEKIKFLGANLPELVHDGEILSKTSWEDVKILNLRMCKLSENVIDEILKKMSDSSIVAFISDKQGYIRQELSDTSIRFDEDLKNVIKK